jgi:hypothetical protein
LTEEPKDKKKSGPALFEYRGKKRPDPTKAQA